MHRIIFYSLFLVFCHVVSVAQTPASMFKTIPVVGTMLQVDELGNAYVVRRDNVLIKYNESGDSLANYSSISNGKISNVDVTNPLRVMLYYSKFAKMVLLDRMLAPKNELNLRKLNQLNINAIAVSADGNLWVYDQFSATLNKLDMELNYMIRGNDLRQQLSELPAAAYLSERDRKVYLADSIQGVLVFDQYGSYLNTLPFIGVHKIQVVGNQIVYYKENMLHVYDMERSQERSLAVPPLAAKQILDAALCRNVLYVLYEDRLVLCNIPN